MMFNFLVYVDNYISGFAKNNYSMVTAHIMNDGVHDIDELLVQIIERILNAIGPEKWHDKIFKIGKYMESVGFGLKIKVNFFKGCWVKEKLHGIVKQSLKAIIFN